MSTNELNQIVEGVGISLASLVFSFLEFGLLASQLIFLKRYRKIEGFTQFILLTALFVSLNLSLLLVSINSISPETAFSLQIFNAISIALYLFFLNLSSFLPAQNGWKRIPWFVIALSLAFGVHGITRTIQANGDNIESLTQIVVPIVLALTMTMLVFKKSKNNSFSFHGFWTALLLFITFIFGSFIIYSSNLKFASYLYVNIIFLLFASVQYRTVIRKMKELREKEKLTSLDDYGFTATEREIVEMILQGYSYQEIASKRVRSYGSITAHAHNIFAKVGDVHSQEDLIKKLSKNLDK